jgi:hypothetical protein
MVSKSEKLLKDLRIHQWKLVKLFIQTKVIQEARKNKLKNKLRKNHKIQKNRKQRNRRKKRKRNDLCIVRPI